MTYDPESAKVWANSVVNFLNGDGESFRACSTKFNAQIEKLVAPDVWTGSAAAKNYQNFMETHNAMIQFINSFGNSFAEAMTSVNRNVASLETANLGADTNVSSTFGNLSYAQINAQAEETINKSYVHYNYSVISSIGSDLNNIELSLENLKSNLERKIAELDSGAKIWDGAAARNAKENLTNTLNTNMQKVFESLKICISNISSAAEAAQMADQG